MARRMVFQTRQGEGYETQSESHTMCIPTIAVQTDPQAAQSSAHSNGVHLHADLCGFGGSRQRGAFYLGQWGSYSSGNGQFNHPSSIAVDRNCNVYIADAENHRIQKFSTVP